MIRLLMLLMMLSALSACTNVTAPSTCLTHRPAAPSTIPLCQGVK